MQTEKIQAVVVSTLDYGDSDKIVALFSLEHGLIKAFARGAKKSRKRFGAALEGFARIEVEVGIKSGLSTLKQADIITIYPGIRNDLSAISHALYACELVSAMTPEVYPIPRLYRLLIAYLERLETELYNLDDRRFFEINLLNILGYRPSLTECPRCKSRFEDDHAVLQDSGEPVCNSCASTGERLDLATLQALRSCMATGTFGKIQLPQNMLEQAGALLDKAIANHAGKRLKSLEFMAQL